MSGTVFKIAIIGSGPAGLMAATELVQLSQKLPRSQKLEIHLFEKRAGLGRKLLIAGSSGLNISHDLTASEFAKHYEGYGADYWRKLFTNFGVKDWKGFIEEELELETFVGTSNRYFVREMKASSLLKRWTEYLTQYVVQIHSKMIWVGFAESDSHKDKNSSSISFVFEKSENQLRETLEFNRAIFALGGGSWEKETPNWMRAFTDAGIEVAPFTPSNVGYEVDWNDKFLTESEGKPLKKVSLTTSRGTKLGEMVVTKYGLEGTPMYFCGTEGHAFLDLKPDLTEAEIVRRLSQSSENFSPMRRVKKFLGLSEAAESLIFHHASAVAKTSIESISKVVKRFPIELKRARPLEEAISSRGGVKLSELNEEGSLKRFPLAYCAGEMLDWDAPTGGFLIQASVSQGATSARCLARSLGF